MASTISSSFTSNTFTSLSSTTNHPRHAATSTSHVSFRRPLSTISAVYTTTNYSTSSSVGVASNTSLQNSSFYEVLGIPAGASGKEIKAAYRKLARVLHPDVALVTSNNATSSVDEFIKVHEAYATLSDPKKRADYDRMMWLQGRRLSYSPTYCSMSSGTKYGGGTTSCSGFSGYTRRTWETDQCW
ncbi:chaperone protein dnaJ 11, chloroplastic-like [Chenopodium quinoa]|uniref:J domain-containing protein n=1 Tax=Chenopodium quinoa TaxID=63459 RepID=A0A803N7Z6_CHEQI|nr:chaperone protein dnaJ 11, chloroplastic-like [Chenopodium quinoa]